MSERCKPSELVGATIKSVTQNGQGYLVFKLSGKRALMCLIDKTFDKDGNLLDTDAVEFKEPKK